MATSLWDTAPPTPSAPPTQGGSSLWSTSPAGGHKGSSLWDTSPTKTPVAGTQRGSFLGPLGRVLDAQRWAVAKGLTGETDPDKQRASYRHSLHLDDIYNAVPHPVKGLIDFGLDTAADPFTYETGVGGAIEQAGIRGAKLLSPLAKAAMKVAPQGVRTAVKDAGDIAQTVRHGLTRNLVPGGAAVGDLENQRGRGARDLLLGASGKHALNEAEMKRAFVKTI